MKKTRKRAPPAASLSAAEKAPSRGHAADRKGPEYLLPPRPPSARPNTKGTGSGPWIPKLGPAQLNALAFVEPDSIYINYVKWNNLIPYDAGYHGAASTDISIADLAPWASSYVNWTLPGLTGFEHSFYCYLDSNGVVTESRKDNNFDYQNIILV
jgi:hypothetical protein